MTLRILIVKLGAIGDIIHTLPALNALRSAVPDAVISWVAESRSAEILRGNPMLDNLIEVDTRSLRGGKVIERMLIDAAGQVKELRRHEFDVAIDFQGLLKSGVITRLSGAKARWGFSRADLREPAARVFYTNTARSTAGMHVIHRNLALAEAALGIEVPTEKIAFPISTTKSDLREAEEIARKAGERFAILNPAGGWVTKLWHAEKYGQLADMIWEAHGISSIVVAGPNESALASTVLASSRSGRTTVATPGLKAFYQLAKQASVYIGGDTGPTHLAIAAGTPIVGIFGPTEWWRNGSLDPSDICVERVDIGCRVDCHRRTCSNWICMDTSPETVFAAVQARLARATEPEPAASNSKDY